VQGPGTREAKQQQQHAQQLLADVVRVLVRLGEAALFVFGCVAAYGLLRGLLPRPRDADQFANQYHRLARHGAAHGGEVERE
jgi:hypothetical protein